MELTKSLEEYITTIYILEQNEDRIRVTDIAEEMIVTKPSVNRAMKTLKEKGIINYEPYSDISLTEKGKKIAQNILKKHDVVKIFLIEILGVDDITASEDSAKIKSAISEETEEKLEQFMTKALKIDELKCNHSWENERCRECKRPLSHLYTKILG